MKAQIKRPGAGRTPGATSNHSRFTRNGFVNTAIWQPKNREQLATWRGADSDREDRHPKGGEKYGR